MSLMRWVSRVIVLVGIIAGALGTALAPRTARSAEALLMFQTAGCGWCTRWDAEIGAVYDKTAEGRRAPLRRLDIDAPLPPDLAFAHRPHFTPTFVLMRDGVEVGRIEGYPGEQFFWPMLARLLARPVP